MIKQIKLKGALRLLGSAVSQRNMILVILNKILDPVPKINLDLIESYTELMNTASKFQEGIRSYSFPDSKDRRAIFECPKKEDNENILKRLTLILNEGKKLMD